MNKYRIVVREICISSTFDFYVMAENEKSAIEKAWNQLKSGSYSESFYKYMGKVIPFSIKVNNGVCSEYMNNLKRLSEDFKKHIFLTYAKAIHNHRVNNNHWKDDEYETFLESIEN